MMAHGVSGCETRSSDPGMIYLRVNWEDRKTYEAAPDLLEALQFVLEHGTFDQRGTVKRVVQEAIAKATAK